MSDAPMIWTRRPKIIEPKSEIAFGPKLGGFFKLEAVRPDGRRRLLADWFPNLITDSGLDVPGTQTEWCDSCKVGTGNATPSVSDTALVSQVASTTTRTDTSGASNQTADRYTYGRRTFRFSAGSAAGNLAEIGIQSDGYFFSRALILDGVGAPTTITVLSDEVLDATYEIRNYPPLSDLVTTMMIGSTEHDIVLRACEVDSLWDMLGGGSVRIGWKAGAATNGAQVYPSTSTLGAVTASPTGTASVFSSSSSSTYVNGTSYRDFAYSWNLSSGNVSGGIAAARITCGLQPPSAGEGTSGLCFQLSFDPVIPKTSSNNLVLNFRQSWARKTI
ncbi:MAG: hypothetical protein IT480_06450 [Gammaproteobacteria bacterium]|nr:hypothetical protein [Gammaproteobacteria bacterium]